MQRLIDERLPQWKGNLHTHTHYSDGRKQAAEVVKLYEDAGYDFLSLTDHRKVTDPAQFDTPLLLIPGIELDYFISSLQSYRDAIANEDETSLIALLEEGKRRKEQVDR